MDNYNMDQFLVYWATTAKMAKGAIIPKITNEMQNVIFLSFFFFITSMKQKKQGKRTPIEVEQMAPIKLNTTSISSTLMPIPSIIRKIPKVQMQKRRLAFLRFSTLSWLWMQELIISTLSPSDLHFLAAPSSDLVNSSCMSAMKLFLHPKNIIGKAKNTDRRNPQLMTKKMAGLIYAQGSDSKKLALTCRGIGNWLLLMVCTRWYPIMPTSRQEHEQTKMPVKEARAIFLSLEFLMPLNTGQKFIWNARARMRFGIEAIAQNQSEGKRSIEQLLPMLESQSDKEMKQCTTKAPMNTKMPVTPINAMNLSLSIFFTMMEGIQQQPITKAMKILLVQNQLRAGSPSGSTSSMILRMLALKIMIQMMQIPILLKKINKDPIALENLFWQMWCITVEKLLCPDRFFALSRSTLVNWFSKAAPRNIMMENTYPHLLTVKGSPRMPDPMMVLMMVVTVSRKSKYRDSILDLFLLSTWLKTLCYPFSSPLSSVGGRSASSSQPLKKDSWCYSDQLTSRSLTLSKGTDMESKNNNNKQNSYHSCFDYCL